LRETPDERSAAAPDVPRSQRTEWNVRDADATLVFSPDGVTPPDAGTEWTVQCARAAQKPLLVCDPSDERYLGTVLPWLRSAPIGALNVAGPSERVAPGIGQVVERLLLAVFTRILVVS